MHSNILGKPRVEPTPPEETVIEEVLDEPTEELIEEIINTPRASPMQVIMDSLDLLHKLYFKVTWDLIGINMPDMSYFNVGQNTDDAAEPKPEPLPIFMQPVQQPRTIMHRRDNIPINKSELIVDESVGGHLDEVMAKSTTEFSVEVMIDDTLFIHETMTDLIDISADISSIVAIYDGTNYKFSISDISYGTLVVRIFLETSGQFDIFKKLTRGANANRY